MSPTAAAATAETSSTGRGHSIGECGGNRRRQRHQDDRQAQHLEQAHPRHAERPYAVAQHVDGRDIEQRVADDDRERALDQRRQMVAQHCPKRTAIRLSSAIAALKAGVSSSATEHRALCDQDRAHEERNAPGPFDDAGSPNPISRARNSPVAMKKPIGGPS